MEKLPISKVKRIRYAFYFCLSVFLIYILSTRGKYSNVELTVTAKIISDELHLNCQCKRPIQKKLEKIAKSLCNEISSDRGLGQKVVSYSLFGDHATEKSLQYFRQVEDRIKEVNYYYQGWIMRLYHNASENDSYSKNLICKLFCKYDNFDPCDVNKIEIPKNWWYDSSESIQKLSNHEPKLKNERDLTVSSNISEKSKNFSKSKNTLNLFSSFKNSLLKLDTISEILKDLRIKAEKDRISKKYFSEILNGRSWRFLVLADPTVRQFLIRDIDSFILPREVAAVNEWLHNSTMMVHAMRDHPNHNGVLLAGMWGALRYRDEGQMTSFLKEMTELPNRKVWNFDQILLYRVVWPKILDDVLVHDSYYCLNHILVSNTPSQPFPTQRRGKMFVSWGPFRNPSELDAINECPIECRPKNHRNWKYC